MSEAHRRVWAASVAKLVYPVDPARATAKIVDYLAFLTDVPTEAFNAHSAEAVALYDRRMALPSFDEVAKPLRAWWRENRPRANLIALGAPTRVLSDPEHKTGPTPEEIAAVEATVKAFVAERSEGARLRPSGVEPKYLTGEALERHRASSPLVQQARRFAAEHAIKAEDGA